MKLTHDLLLTMEVTEPSPKPKWIVSDGVADKSNVDKKLVRRFKCSECPQSYNSQRNLLLHAAIHNDSPFICPECGRRFIRFASFKAHLPIHEEEDNLTCPHCNEDFPTDDILADHIKQHGEDTGSEEKSGFSCSSCTQVFSSKKLLLDHKLEHVRINKLLKSKQKRTKRQASRTFLNVCKHCPKSFRKRSQCIRHERIHTGEKPFKCKICSKSFNQKGSLEIHERRHTGQKPYQCEICNVSFAQSGNLKTHILRIHSASLTATEIYNCEECSCAFKKIGSLNSHISKYHASNSNSKAGGTIPTSAPESKHVIVLAEKDENGVVRKHVVRFREIKGEKLYSCQQCFKEFKKPSDLCRHFKVHAKGGQSFSCKFCTRSFSSKSALLAHIRIHSEATESKSRSLLGPKAGNRNLTSNDSEKFKKPITNFHCLGCSLDFATEMLLRKHQESCFETEASEESRPIVIQSKTSDIFQAPVSLPDNHQVINIVYNENLLPMIPENAAQFQTDSSLSIIPTVSDDGVISINPSVLGLDVSTFGIEPDPKDLVGLSDPKLDQLDVQGTAELNVLPSPSVVIVKENPEDFQRSIESASISEEVLKSSLLERSLVKEIKAGPSTTLKPKFANSCTFCPKTFRKPSDLVRHLRTHTGEKPFQCETCQRCFSLKSTLESHMKTHQDVKGNDSSRVQCHICLSYFAKKCALKTHMRLHTGAAPYRCPKCPQQFRTPGLRKNHMASHPEEAGSNINETTATEPLEQRIRISVPSTSLSEALNSVNDIGVPLLGSIVRIQLDGTGVESTIANIQVDQTLLDQLQKGGNVSLLIDPTNTNLSTLEEPDQPSLKPNDVPEPVEAAQEGGPRSNTSTTPSTSSSNACSFCSAQFKKPSQLQRHIRTHTGERPWVCEYPGCNKAFSQKNSLQVHSLKHTGERPFVCPFCAFAFSQKGNLKIHIQRAHSAQAQRLVERTLNTPTSTRT